MWYKRFYFQQTEKGLEDDINVLYHPFTEKELIQFKIEPYYPEFVGMEIPKEITLPDEYIELLNYSNGGLIVNGEREFGFFPLSGVRDFYFGYGFPKWTPLLLPIAFNGGGKFYAYDYRNLEDVHVIAVSSGDLDYERSVSIGKSLDEVLSQTTNIEDELDKIYERPKLTELEQARIEIHKELAKIKNDKEKGLLDLKSFLLKKRELETRLKTLE